MYIIYRKNVFFYGPILLKTCRASREEEEDKILYRKSCPKTYRFANKTNINNAYKSYAFVGLKNTY